MQDIQTDTQKSEILREAHDLARQLFIVVDRLDEIHGGAAVLRNAVFQVIGALVARELDDSEKGE